MVLHRAALVLVCVSLSAALRVSTWPPLNCSQQGLMCTVNETSCMDRGWLDVQPYTPRGPEKLQVSVDVRQDETGQLQPVLVADWKIMDDGSIGYLKATELHVLVASTNQNLCVRYSFKDQLPMRSPSGEKWSFSADMLVLDPGQSYHVSVFNIPKPELDYSSYDVSADVSVPDCQDPTMQRTQFCVERGSLWQPNMTVAEITADSGRPALTVSFSPDPRCHEYRVIVTCSTSQRVVRTHKANQTTLTVTFSLDEWPRSCCQFDAQIKPLFPQCGQDCVRRRTTLDICHVKPTDASAPDVSLYTSAMLGVVFMCVVLAVCVFVICRKPGKPGAAAPPVGGDKPRQQQLQQSPKVLVIYSQDHHLYRDVVLKLCAFLQAKCGVQVLLDLLDSTSVGMVGPLRWLERQWQKLQNPNDKILVLCSQGVQAKWRAMCGQGRVTLREDVLSPTDDILTPFLNRFLPDMNQTGMLGKYMVAYFDDISSEQDVPSVFDIGVKYKLMKHFEELYFRILDIPKYQPGQVNHIEGIDGDEYFNCPSGRALKKAIQTFQTYQWENPDWFERECVDDEEEVITEANMLTAQLHIPPVLECRPLIRDGLPVYIQEVEINENANHGHVLTPELNSESRLSSVAELTPAVNPECLQQYPSLSKDHVYSHSPYLQSVYRVEPVLSNSPQPRQNWLPPNKEPSGQIPAEDEEEVYLLPMKRLSAHPDQRSLVPQNSLDSNPPGPSRVSVQSQCFPLSHISHFQPVDMEPSRKAQSSGSDQGYISKMSSKTEAPSREDPLVALRRLQDELFQRNLRHCDIGPDGN